MMMVVAKLSLFGSQNQNWQRSSVARSRADEWSNFLPTVLWDKIDYAVIEVSSILQNILTSPLNWLLPSSQFPHSKQHHYQLTNNAILHVPSCFMCHPLVPLTSSLTQTASLLHIPSESDISLGKLKYKLSFRLTNIASLLTYNTAYSARNQHLIKQSLCI